MNSTGNSQSEKPLVEWSTGLFDCTSDVKNCCITLWCPCITFGQIAEIVDKGSRACWASGTLYTLVGLVSILIGFPCTWAYSLPYRTKMREQYLLKDKPCCDCLVHFFCEPCALCQEYRELHNRGFDMRSGPRQPLFRNHRSAVPTVLKVLLGKRH